jgi:hypothetical protein
MRFMMLVIPKGYEKDDARKPDPQHLVEMDKYNAALAKAGVLLSLDGLAPPSQGARVTFSGGTPSGGTPKVTDGPFAEAKECVGGHWMIQVKSQEEAIEWAKRAPMYDTETIEVRRVMETDDFFPEERAAVAALEELEGRK